MRESIAPLPCEVTLSLSHPAASSMAYFACTLHDIPIPRRFSPDSAEQPAHHGVLLSSKPGMGDPRIPGHGLQRGPAVCGPHYNKKPHRGGVFIFYRVTATSKALAETLEPKIQKCQGLLRGAFTYFTYPCRPCRPCHPCRPYHPYHRLQTLPSEARQPARLSSASGQRSMRRAAMHSA